MINKQILQPEWEKSFKNCIIRGVAVQSRNVIYLIAAQNKVVDNDRSNSVISLTFPHRFYQLLFNEHSFKCYYEVILGVQAPTISYTHSPSKTEQTQQGVLLNCDSDGQVLLLNRNKLNKELIQDSIPNLENQIWGYKLISILGELYVVTFGRKIYKRLNSNQWIEFRPGLPDYKDQYQEAGFEDLDAFSENDMYVVGGAGDVWHYAGNVWQRINFPSSDEINVVCCAGDGYVYIGAGGGDLWRGRLNQWEKIHHSQSKSDWSDLVWFKDNLYLSNEHGLKVLRGGQLVEVFEGREKYEMLNVRIDSCPDLLVAVSHEFVKTFDGEQWLNLIQPFV